MRVLVVSINAFNVNGSNGKVLAEYFKGWNSDNLAQFYVYNEMPDYPVCKNYFRVTDRDALRAMMSGNGAGRIISSSENSVPSINSDGQTNSPQKNPLTCLLRDIVWNCNRWRGKTFWKWIDDFKPDVVFTMAGASSFIHKIAIDIANHSNAPLVVYNTENYYFKNYNYMKDKGWGLLYPIYYWECRRMFRKLMKYSSVEIYNNKQLDDLYSKEFGKHGTVLYQASTLEPMPSPSSEGPIQFSYAGNLGINRHKALIDIGDALQSISSNFYLDVYGRANPEVAEQLSKAKGIRYHGIIPYNEVLQVMKRSHFMIHAESFDPFWVKDLSTAFSTKISDILSAGKCLILYADTSLACSQYVINNNCGCVISNQGHLKDTLCELIYNNELQSLYKKNAIISAKRDMDGSRNGIIFRQLLNDIVNNKKNEKI